MTDKSRIGDDEAKWELFEKLLEMWDSDVLIEFVQTEYQKGFDAGIASGASKKQLAAEYERGQNDYRDNLLKELDAKYRPKVPDVAKPAEPAVKPAKPIASSIVEVPEKKPSQEPAAASDGGKVPAAPEKRAGEAPADEKTPSEPDPPKTAVPALKNVGGRPSKTRPDGLPTNLAMAVEAIQNLGGKASAPQIRNWARKKYWSELPDAWTACLWDQVAAGHLARDGLNFTLPKKAAAPKPAMPVEPRAPSVPAVRDSVAVAAPPRREIVTPGAKLGPPARGEGVHFKHGDKIITMHQREVEIAIRLRAAMGSGHLDAKFLAGMIGVKYEVESYMKDFISIMNPKLAEIGLAVEFYKGFGFIMREIA